MKKYILFSGFVIILGVMFMACNKETTNKTNVVSSNILKGKYNPKEKIKAIYREVDSEKSLVETWTWEDNLLMKVDFIDEDIYFSFEYDEKRLVKINDYEEGYMDGYSTLTYDNSLLQKIESFDDGELTGKIDITHDKKKITKMTITYYDDDDDYASLKSMHRSKKFSQMMSFVIGKERSQRIMNSLQRKSIETYTIEFTYEGDNVVTVKESEGEDISITYFTYDDKLNPRYGALFIFGWESPAVLFSKNNAIKETYTSTYEIDGETHTNTYTNNYSYVYDGEFPTKMKVDEESYSRTYYYEYLD